MSAGGVVYLTYTKTNLIKASVSNERHRLCWKLFIVYVYILYPYLDTLVKNIPNMLNHFHPERHFVLLCRRISFNPLYTDQLAEVYAPIIYTTIWSVKIIPYTNEGLKQIHLQQWQNPFTIR